MNKLLAPILALLVPVLAKAVTDAIEAMLPKIIATISDSIETWMPQIIKAVVTAVAQSAGQISVNTADKVTDIIPGNLDDHIVDNLVQDIFGRLGWKP